MASVIRGSDNFDSLVHQGIGVNQTWQDVTANRALDVTYTNTTGKPIMVSVYGDTTNSSISAFYIFVNDDAVSVGRNGQYGVSYAGGCVAIVPNGSTYRFHLITGTLSNANFKELR